MNPKKKYYLAPGSLPIKKMCSAQLPHSGSCAARKDVCFALCSGSTAAQSKTNIFALRSAAGVEES
jgi:hypothetical protein